MTSTIMFAKNVSQIANKIFATQYFFHLSLETQNHK